MIEILKIIFSKDFISNAKDVIAIIKKSQNWKKDITRFTGTFYHSTFDESSVLITETLNLIQNKKWSKDEISEVDFILNGLFDNSLKYGLPNKEISFIHAEIIVSSIYIKLRLKDFGIGFNLEEELKKQEAFKFDSEKHKGLSMVNKITPEIYQEDNIKSNIIIMIKRKGLKPLEIEESDGILIFKLGNNTYVNNQNFKLFIERLERVAPNTKIVIDFSNKTNKRFMMKSLAAREVREFIIEKTINDKARFALTGLDNAPWVIKEYFKAKFPIFDNIYDAKEYLINN